MARIKFPSNDWATPLNLYQKLNAEYNFSDFDPCPLANDFNSFNGLEAIWPEDKPVFVNPPYDLVGKTAFVKKAIKHKGVVVLLLPVSTSTKLFHEAIMPNCEIQFLDFRPKYEGINTKGEWVNPGLGRNTEALALYCEAQGLKQVKSPGAHDSMVVITKPLHSLL